MKIDPKYGTNAEQLKSLKYAQAKALVKKDLKRLEKTATADKPTQVMLIGDYPYPDKPAGVALMLLGKQSGGLKDFAKNQIGKVEPLGALGQAYFGGIGEDGQKILKIDLAKGKGKGKSEKISKGLKKLIPQATYNVVFGEVSEETLDKLEQKLDAEPDAPENFDETPDDGGQVEVGDDQKVAKLLSSNLSEIAANLKTVKEQVVPRLQTKPPTPQEFDADLVIDLADLVNEWIEMYKESSIWVKTFHFAQKIKVDGIKKQADDILTMLNKLGIQPTKPVTPPADDNTNPQPQPDNNQNTNNNTPPAAPNPALDKYQQTKAAGSGTIAAKTGKGATNNPEDVAVIKALLVKHAYLSDAAVVADPTKVGEMDPATIAAIEKFQREVRGAANPDGVVDPGKNTLAALNAPKGGSNPNPNPNPAPDNPLVTKFQQVKAAGTGTIAAKTGKGATNNPDDVVTIKALLVKHGYLTEAAVVADPAKIGEMDPATIAAIEQFQREVRGAANPDGVVDPGKNTLAALNAPKGGGGTTPPNANPNPNPNVNPTPLNPGEVVIPDAQQIDKTGDWAKPIRKSAAKIIATPEEVQAIMAKIKQEGSPAYLPSVPKQKVTTFGTMDTYLQTAGVAGYVKGKSQVARPSMDKNDLNKVYGTIDESILPENESASDPQRKAFAAKYIVGKASPFPLNGGSTKTIYLHKSVADSFIAALNEVLAFYGIDMIKKLGMDMYAGGFVFRRMRGSTRASIHAYGCAVDFAAELNGLKDKGNNALFSQPPYLAFFDIMEKYGWHNQGRNKDNDYMHFQAAAY